MTKNECVIKENIDLDNACFMIVDLETTGIDTENDRIIEMSFRLVEPNKKDICFTSFVNPDMHIPSNSSAVHHIIDKDVMSAEDFISVAAKIYPAILKRESIVMVAHNVAFDREFLKDVEVTMPDDSIVKASLRDLPWVCTFRLAKHLYGDSVPSCSNQALRYELDFESVGISLPRDLNPHRAEDDTLVTSSILKHEIKEYKKLGLSTNLNDFISYVKNAYPIKYMPFGKYRPNGTEDDMTIEDIALKDGSYLNWVLNNTDPDYDIRYNIEKAIEFVSSGNKLKIPSR